MARPKIILDHRGMNALLHDPGVQKELERRGEKVAAQARATAPVDTGKYRDSIEVFTHQHPTRVAVHIGANDFKAPFIEAHTGNLSRALDAGGGA